VHQKLDPEIELNGGGERRVGVVEPRPSGKNEKHYEARKRRGPIEGAGGQLAVLGGSGGGKLGGRVGIGPFAAALLHAGPDVLLGGNPHAVLGLQRFADDRRVLGRSLPIRHSWADSSIKSSEML
jgi:hypothetical protein